VDIFDLHTGPAAVARDAARAFRHESGERWSALTEFGLTVTQLARAPFVSATPVALECIRWRRIDCNDSRQQL